LDLVKLPKISLHTASTPHTEATISGKDFTLPEQTLTMSVSVLVAFSVHNSDNHFVRKSEFFCSICQVFLPINDTKINHTQRENPEPSL
jgi:hypothetical protein